jgi:Na+-translocating ferredoxin:NAD+ oxidoreductase RnfC subunit
MSFWTPERCKTIDTLILMDNSCEMSMQAELTKSALRKAQLLKNVEMIQAELRSRN